ncbi:MAG: universal stress protein [Verrucomicrobiota bacterium]|jgi:nucleotide-binding universal stress UspA family protein|nr:universal stress protein [Verrucomicrobiota bacterium]
MFKNILFGIDGSSFSDIACEYALDLAARLDARLEAVHVVDSRVLEFPLLTPTPGCMAWAPFGLNELQQALRSRGENLLRETAARAEKTGVPILTTLEFGHPAQVLADIQTRTELVILGRQGEHARNAPDIAGSTMDRFIRRATRPCLVTPAEFRPIQKILVGVDGSASGSRALHEAAELANALHIPLLILAAAERENDEPTARRIVNEAHSLVRAHDCAAASFITHGAPALQILEQAASTNSDLIVLGSHGHGWIYDRLIGSVAAHVVSHSPVPVMLVR